jgi:hypothetical protein
MAVSGPEMKQLGGVSRARLYGRGYPRGTSRSDLQDRLDRSRRPVAAENGAGGRGEWREFFTEAVYRRYNDRAAQFAPADLLAWAHEGCQGCDPDN